ncbi:MAG: hypothetical protein WCT40_02390 [Candidatus Magasanikbacteria bacterium]|jgi:probable HAF family extracellular repeat protein
MKNPSLTILAIMTMAVFFTTPVLARAEQVRVVSSQRLAWSGWDKISAWWKKSATKNPTVTNSSNNTNVSSPAQSQSAVVAPMAPVVKPPVTKAPAKTTIKKPVIIKKINSTIINTNHSSVVSGQSAATTKPVDKQVTPNTVFSETLVPTVISTPATNQSDAADDNSVAPNVNSFKYISPAKTVITKLGHMRQENPTTAALGLNNNGDTVGYSMKTSYENAHPYLYKNGKMTDIGGGYGGAALAVNDTGQAVGYIQISSNPHTGGGEKHAFIWDNGKVTRIGSYPGYALDINNKKQVVGQLNVGQADGFPVRAFIWEKGIVKYLGNLGGDENDGATTASAINDQGQIVGCSLAKNGQQHPYLWQGGKMIDLAEKYNVSGCAVDINNNGQILGNHFLLTDGQVDSLNEAPDYFIAVHINDNGDIIGTVSDQVYIRRNGVYRIYNNLDGYILSPFEGIGFNNNNQIAVMARVDTDGNSDALVVSLPDNTPPILKNLNAVIENDKSGQSYVPKIHIFWEDSDVDDNAKISLYYYEEKGGASVDVNKPGRLITDSIQEDGPNEYVWDVGSDNIVDKGGRYQVYAVIDDGANSPKKVYSNEMEQKLSWWGFCVAKLTGKKYHTTYDEMEEKNMGGC